MQAVLDGSPALMGHLVPYQYLEDLLCPFQYLEEPRPVLSDLPEEDLSLFPISFRLDRSQCWQTHRNLPPAEKQICYSGILRYRYLKH
jgi:hypothetical protein